MTNLNALRIGFIGAGRMGRGLAIAFDQADFHVTAVYSRSPESARQLAANIADCEALETSQAVADACDLIFVTVPDEQIEAVTQSVKWVSGQAVVHCSGATEISTLGSAQRTGAEIGGFHPMQSFTDPEAAAASLAGCTVTIEAASPLNETLEALAKALGCKVNRLPPGKRALYHASAGFGSQFINVLLEETASVWRDWGASDEDVIGAILPMIRGTLASIESSGIAGGMPGPVSRGDVETVAKHVAALRSLDPEHLVFYRAHCLRTVELAVKAERIDTETAENLRKALG